MARTSLLVAAAVAIAALYYFSFVQVLGVTSVRVLTPGFVHGAKDIGGVPLLRLSFYAIDLVVTLIVSIPFAFVIVRIFGTKWLAVALLVGACAAAPDLLAVPDIWPYDTDHLRYASNLAISTIRLLVVLPALTYLVLRLTSNNRWRGP